MFKEKGKDKLYSIRTRKVEIWKQRCNEFPWNSARWRQSMRVALSKTAAQQKITRQTDVSYILQHQILLGTKERAIIRNVKI